MKIEFTTNGAAFCDPHTGEEDNYYKAMTCKGILENILEKIEEGYTSGSVIDFNGNKIGTWEL